jgi:GT2 family glycosyltransferase
MSIFSACGAALFLSRAMLTDVAPDGEYFAESFFAYKEDIDLGWRARLLGWDIRYIPAAAAYHVRTLPLAGDAWRHMSLPARRHSWKNHYLLMIRNDRVSDLIRSFPFVAAWEVVRIGHALLRDPRVLGAYVDLAREIRPALRARRDIQRRRRASVRELRRWFGGDPVPVPGRLEADRSTAVLP